MDNARYPDQRLVAMQLRGLLLIQSARLANLIEEVHHGLQHSVQRYEWAEWANTVDALGEDLEVVKTFLIQHTQRWESAPVSDVE